MLLDSYDFISFDEFDLALLKGIEKGFFDPVTIDEKGSTLDARVKDEKASGFGGFGAASQYMEISKRAKEALHRLAGESTLNALRVGAYSGVRK